MKHLFLLTLTFIVVNTSIKAQSCGTPIPKNPIVYSETTKARSANSTYCIDIFFHIVRNSNGSNAFNPPNTNNIVNDLNSFYNVHGIFIRNAGTAFINNTNFVNIDNSAEAVNLGQTNNNPNTINYYIVETLWNVGTGFVTGTANSIPSNNLVIRNDRVLTSTSPHELGHCLNLLHTHETARGVEAINGSNCNTAGDFVCDTPADPRLGTGNVNTNCIYTGGGGFAPLTNNIMSYSRANCRDELTTGQGQRIRTAISVEPVLSGITGTNCTIPRLSSIDHLCTSGSKTITVSNLGNNTTTWTVSSNLSIVSSNNSSITIKASSSSAQGNAFVRAAFSNTTYNPTESFWVGKPKLYNAGISGSSSVGCNSIYIYDYLGSVAGATSTRWVVSLQFNNISSVNGYELFVDPTNGGDGYVTFVASNDCGEEIFCKPVSVTGWSCGPGYINFPNQYSCGGSSGFPFGTKIQSDDFTIFPNPAPNGETTILSTNQEPLSVETSGGAASRKNAEETTVEIYRASDHKVVYSDSYKNEQFLVNNSNLEPGIYYYVITRGETKEVKRIIVEPKPLWYKK